MINYQNYNYKRPTYMCLLEYIHYNQDIQVYKSYG